MVDRLNGKEIIQIGIAFCCNLMLPQVFRILLTLTECGAQFSLALSKTGKIWTWGKGDYFRLGHGHDEHIRHPTVIERLQHKKVVKVAVGALHCLAITDDGKVRSLCADFDRQFYPWYPPSCDQGFGAVVN